MGSVDLARPIATGAGLPRLVVIKRMHTELAENDLFLKRFRHEGEAAVRIDSPYVAKVFDVGTVGPTAYIAMELINGFRLSEFLDALVREARHVPVDVAAELFSGMLEGLEALRTATDANGRPLGFVHRDLSPKNLMVVDDGLIHIIDLGLGKSSVQDWKTRTGLVMGSPGYMSPEQALARPVDHRSDLYTAGIVFFELLTLRRYIKRGALPDVLARSAEPEFLPPSHIRPDLPVSLDAILEKVLDPVPDKRFATAGELLDAVRGAVRWKKGSSARTVTSIFSKQLAEREARYRELLSIPIEAIDAPPEPTVIFARASGVVRAFEAERARALVRRERSVEESSARTRITGAEDAPDTLPDGVDESARTRVDESPPAHSNPRAAALVDPRANGRSGVSYVAMFGAVVATAGLAFAAGWFFRPPEPVEAPAEVELAEPVGATAGEAPPTPAPKPRPMSKPERPESKPERPESKPERPESKPERPESKPEPTKDPPKAPPKPPAADTRSVEEIVRSVMTRASAVMRDKPERAAEAQAIIGDASLEAKRDDAEAARKTLGRLEQQLSELER
ncbi:MAG: serine/threonine protein kinase [Deltaproteobacteria bacterium]|nr:serine/threonine protein kinase [Deltaproteobacteria bacterium]